MAPRAPSLRVFRAETANPLHLPGCLPAGNAHDLHEFGGHFGGDLILNAAVPVGIRRQKNHNLLLGNSGRLQTVKKLTVSDFTARRFDLREKFFAIGAEPRPQTAPFTAINAPSHGRL
jgi:hypothetical protein